MSTLKHIDLILVHIDPTQSQEKLYNLQKTDMEHTHIDLIKI